MNICVITKNQKTYFIRRLIEEVGQERVVFFNPWEDSNNPKADVYLVRTTGVYGSDRDLELLQDLPKERIFNSPAALTRFRTKLSQARFFEEEKIRHPDTHALWESVPVIDGKMLVKPNRGQAGWGIQVFEAADFQAYWKSKQEEGDTEYLLQPFIDQGPEFRLFFIRNEAPLILERTARPGAPANFGQGGEAIKASLSASDLAPLTQLIQKSGAFYGAIDFFLTPNGPLILELNTAPGIEQLEAVTGENVMARLIRQVFLSVSVKF